MKCNIVTGSHFLLFCSSLQYRSALVATRMRNIILFYSWQDNRGSVGKFCPNWFFQQFSFVKIGIRDVTALCAVFLPLRLSCKGGHWKRCLFLEKRMKMQSVSILVSSFQTSRFQVCSDFHKSLDSFISTYRGVYEGIFMRISSLLCFMH